MQRMTQGVKNIFMKPVTNTNSQVDLSSRQLTALSLRASQLSNSIRWDCVVTLSLAENKLASLPASLAPSLTLLRYLNLKANQFKEFPSVLCAFKTLEILDLSRNKIKALPYNSLGNLCATLKVFSIAKNRITYIPPYFGDFVQLEVFKFDGNPLQWPPAEIMAAAVDSNLQDLKQFLKTTDLPSSFVPSSPQDPLVFGVNGGTSTPDPLRRDRNAIFFKISSSSMPHIVQFSNTYSSSINRQ
ncbi:hypothetical protein BJ741DRAFT_384505 [Chytriomyces cf. hyalinus JEL632]|nr:hypothetical protein BJ741DRAFT_384505 [Chytriomyces cf. hyalinus JEL632]